MRKDTFRESRKEGIKAYLCAILQSTRKLDQVKTLVLDCPGFLVAAPQGSVRPHESRSELGKEEILRQRFGAKPVRLSADE